MAEGVVPRHWMSYGELVEANIKEPETWGMIPFCGATVLRDEVSG